MCYNTCLSKASYIFFHLKTTKVVINITKYLEPSFQIEEKITSLIIFIITMTYYFH